jgi:hypothetical protein
MTVDRRVALVSGRFWVPLTVVDQSLRPANRSTGEYHQWHPNGADRWPNRRLQRTRAAA